MKSVSQESEKVRWVKVGEVWSVFRGGEVSRLVE